MTIQELKVWLASLPDEFNEFDVVVRDYDYLGEDREYHTALDKPVISIFIDEEHGEMALLDEKSRNTYEEIVEKYGSEDN